jgi:hypothetical protein
MEHFTPVTLFGIISAFVAVGILVGAWFHARYARKVRVKVGPDGIEVEGQTVKQVETLLPGAEALHQRSQGKLGHERRAGPYGKDGRGGDSGADHRGGGAGGAALPRILHRQYPQPNTRAAYGTAGALPCAGPRSAVFPELRHVQPVHVSACPANSQARLSLSRRLFSGTSIGAEGTESPIGTPAALFRLLSEAAYPAEPAQLHRVGAGAPAPNARGGGVNGRVEMIRSRTIGKVCFSTGTVENPVRKRRGMSVATQRVRLFNVLHHEEARENNW